jgi:4-amino-4-deoxy-L-arabinose transferase-like glycosyltransferase
MQRLGVWPVLLLLWLVTLLVGIGIRPLVPVDELRYIAVAWEMWQRGEFLVPIFNGEPYSHKPPLFFWLIHAGWWLFGVNEWTARLLAPLLTLLSLVATAGLARRLWPDDAVTPRLTPLVLFACVLLVAFFTWLQIDMLLVLMTVLAMHGVLLAAQGSRRGWLLTGVALGLGILAKGPVSLLHILPPALFAPLWLADRPAGGWRRWYAGVLAAVVIAAAMALAWALPAAAAGGEAYSRAILWGQTAGRVVESFAHAHPAWWYLPWLPVLFAPWIFLPWLWTAARAAWPAQDVGLRFCMIWMLAVFVLLSLVSGKQLKYLLPLLPAFALLVSRVLACMDTQPLRQRPWLLAVVLSALGVVGILAPHHLQQAAWLNEIHPGWGLALLVCAATLLQLRPLSPREYPQRMALLSVVVVGIGELGVLRIGAPSYDLQEASRLLARAQGDDQSIAVVSRYHGEFTFYGRLQRPVEQLKPVEVDEWAEHHPDDYLVLTGRDLPADYPRAIYNHPWRSGRMVIVRGDVLIPYNGAPQASRE